MSRRIIYWLPRVTAVLFIAFISIFALDVLGEPNWFFALLIHLLPSFALFLLTILAWRNARMGGWLFLLIAFVFLLVSRAEATIIYIPMALIGVLFFASSSY